ncbi:hypothetical protein CYMTET_44901 [Cymbomonas tetramitiformis]|uniref:DDE-1 domain-containing protein n=1 Tax=Cymbomonas tetramitiformis TaxID=36881 RepID=A0AAE0C0H7_9CHLO|nr:hypothetical protein CYMTET_44901 [Cymbomonas tetramitiformis]|eukprot:gene20274-24279_t
MVSTGSDRYSIDLSRIITSDEAPNPLSATLAGHYGKILFGTGQRANRVKQLNRERVSLDVYLGCDGTWYDPHLMLGSKTIFENQIPVMKREVDVLISTQPNAFQDNTTLLAALKHLNKQVVQLEVKKPIVWLTDAQSARFNLRVMEYAEDNGFFEFVYPPHTTTAHALLDRVFHMWHTTYSKQVERWSKANPGKAITKAVFGAVFPAAWDRWQKSIRDVPSVASKEEIKKSNTVKEEMATLPPITPQEGTFHTRQQKLEEENRLLREELLRLRSQPLSPEEIDLCTSSTDAQIPSVGTSKKKATQVWGSVPATGLRKMLRDAEDKERQRQEGLELQQMFASCSRELERIEQEENAQAEDAEMEEPGQAEIFRACEVELIRLEKEAKKARREEEKAQKAAEKAAERQHKKRERERVAQEKRTELDARKRALLHSRAGQETSVAGALCESGGFVTAP